MKKIIALTILYTLLLSLLCIYSYADDKLTFTVGNVSGVIGENVIIPIDVTNNPGFNNVALRVTYDPDVLEIIEITFPEPEMPANSQYLLTTNPGSQRISLINTRIINWTGNGTVANIEFKINLEAEEGTTDIIITFTETPDGIPINSNGDIVEADTIDGRVTLTFPQEELDEETNIITLIITGTAVLVLVIVIVIIVKKRKK